MRLTKPQKNVLAALKSLPARYRYKQKAGAPIRLMYTEAYNSRVLNSLTEKGLLRFTEFGVVVADH